MWPVRNSSQRASEPRLRFLPVKVHRQLRHDSPVFSFSGVHSITISSCHSLVLDYFAPSLVFPFAICSPVADCFPLLPPPTNRLRNLPTCAGPPNKGYAYDHDHDLRRITLAHTIGVTEKLSRRHESRPPSSSMRHT